MFAAVCRLIFVYDRTYRIISNRYKVFVVWCVRYALYCSLGSDRNDRRDCFSFPSPCCEHDKNKKTQHIGFLVK